MSPLRQSARQPSTLHGAAALDNVMRVHHEDVERPRTALRVSLDIAVR
jgi:hypothetical protein